MQQEQAKPREIGRRLRVWRARRGLSQKQVAYLAETTQPTISRVEKGIKPRVSLGRKLEHLMSAKNDEAEEIDPEIIRAITESKEIRALVQRIVKTLNE